MSNHEPLRAGLAMALRTADRADTACALCVLQAMCRWNLIGMLKHPAVA